MRLRGMPETGILLVHLRRRAVIQDLREVLVTQAQPVIHLRHHLRLDHHLGLQVVAVVQAALEVQEAVLAEKHPVRRLLVLHPQALLLQLHRQVLHQRRKALMRKLMARKTISLREELITMITPESHRHLPPHLQSRIMTLKKWRQFPSVL